VKHWQRKDREPKKAGESGTRAHRRRAPQRRGRDGRSPM